MSHGTPVTETSGAMIGPYRLEGLIGRGGMGEVYRAFDTRRSRVVALKLLPQQFAADDEYRARFSRECHHAAGLRSPHVVPIHDFGEIDGRLFLDMRLVEGVGLDQVIAAGPVEPARAVAIAAQVAEALNDAHTHGLVHRDVKPSNVMIAPSDFAYLLDFGISRSLDDAGTALTQTGHAVGTLAYMAPERFEGGSADHRSDLYSLACLLAECLTGRPPFEATSLPSLMRAHFAGEPPRPSALRPGLNPALDAVVARGMAKDPAARFGSARELAAAAHHAIHAGPDQLASTSSGRASQGGSRRRPLRTVGLATGAVVLLAAAVGAGVLIGAGDRSAEATGAGATTASPATTSSTPTTTQVGAPASTAPTLGLPGRVSPKDATTAYTYRLESNYPAFVTYTDAQGDMVSAAEIADLPWSLEVPTSGWGKDAFPTLTASSSSTRGDTTLTCTITDADGAVVATQSKSAAYAAASCMRF
ncbi:serine/threonine-protein kinase [Pseudonocardia pini]|uniref:serine/threonine-protein kinase n=1 Tax=Pseudonocardia pini TaxID=2758030 RepID=UPI001FE555C5|nr:serine/threonine-protein kinase [Pseudonocardia pini]